MPWVQYTRNFEDVILCRALRGIERGFFLDVGASHPVIDSNTCALYERGWRGIAVEPLREMGEAWAQARPADVFVACAAGAAEGETELHLFPRAIQITTAHPDHARRWREEGHAAETRRVPVRRLDAVLAEHHDRRELHLLSIDVEGQESAALAGFDFHRHRPWVMVIEATEPGTRIPSHAAWEPKVLQHGYDMVYFDGVNRFYLAREHAELKEHFALPPNVWDDFVSFARTAASPSPVGEHPR